MRQIKVGLIGFGLSGKAFHTPLLKAHKGFDVIAISSSKKEEALSFWPQAKVFADASQVISHPDVELVINASPNTFHYSLTKEALKQRKHVLVEKPFVNTIAEGEELIKLAEKENLVLTVFHNRRWDSDFLTVEKLILSGALGEIFQFESHFDRWKPVVRKERWKEQQHPGSGLLSDLGPHLIDQMLRLFGPPETVFADLEIQKTGGEMDDYFHLIFSYKTMRVILHSSSFARYTSRFQILGSKAQFTKFGLDPQETQMREGLSLENPLFGVEPDENFGQLRQNESFNFEHLVSERGCYIRFFDQLYLSLTEGQAPPVLAKEALQVVQLIERARESAKTGKVLPISLG